jgi:hypothetical protein
MARTETTAPAEVVTEAPAKSTPEAPALIYLAEHRILKQPQVTEIAYYKGAELVRATVINPCPLQPGVGYTLAEIEAAHAS